MDDWTRIADDTVLFRETLELKFRSPNGEYLIVLGPHRNEQLVVHHKKQVEIWPVMTKAKRENGYKICGLADWVPEILTDVCWYELIIGPEVSITYWGDKVINRVDVALS